MKKIIPKDGGFEQKTKSRFRVEFPENFHIPAYTVKKASKPIMINGEWGFISITLHDPVKGSTSVAVYDLWKSVGKRKIDGTDEVFKYNIISLGPTGDVIEDWEITISDIINIGFGELDCTNDESLEVHVVFKPSDCILNKFKED